MKSSIWKLTGSIYLVLDPAMNQTDLFKKLEEVLKRDEIAAVQIWDNFPVACNKIALVDKICRISHKMKIPVFVNNDWELLKATEADGVHFDEIPQELPQIKKSLSRDFRKGITCNNDLSVAQWAEENQFDYISFCSVFPSPTSNSCEPVDLETIRKVRKLTSMPVFLAGGIRPENIQRLKGLDFQGVAVISGIMNSEEPGTSTKRYEEEIKKIKDENISH